MADGIIKIDIEVDGKKVVAASKELDGLEASAIKSGAGAKKASDNINNLGSSSKNASGGVKGTADSLSNMGKSADDAANSTKKAAQEAMNIGNESGRASMSIKDIAVSLGLVAVAAAAFNVLKASLDGAISRFDTLQSFPVIMEKMGFSSEQAKGSVEKLSEGIQGLPTTLDGIVTSAKSIALLTGDLDVATDTALSLNNAFLASGSSAVDAERGLTQYVQMLSKGSVDMQSWRTLQETMGYALNETAKAFNFTGKAAQNDLYKALKDGDITFDAFNNKIIELNGGVGGFAEVAKSSSAGISTSMSNLKNAVVVGIANMISAFDKLSQEVTGKSIAENMDSLKVVVGASFKFINSTIESATPVVKSFADAVSAATPIVKTLSPAIIGLVAAYTAYTVITKAQAAIAASNATLKIAMASTKALTLATQGQTLAQILSTNATTADIAAKLSQLSTIKLSSLAIGVLSGQVKLATAAVTIKTAVTYAWAAAVKFLMGPIGWITAGIALLVTGVIAVVKWFNRSTEESERLRGATDELAESTKALNDSVNGTADAHERNKSGIESTAAANTDLVAKIEELLAVENKSSAHKKELQSYVDSLNGSVEGLSLAYSKEANSLNMTSEEIAAKIALMKEQDTLIASQERFLEISKEQNEVDMQLSEVIALQKEWEQSLEDGTVTKGKAKTATEELNEKEIALKETKAELIEQQLETEAQITASIQAVAAATEESVNDQVVAYEFLEDSQKDIVDSLKSTWEDYKKQATDMFDKLSEKSKLSITEMTKNLEENQRIMTNWSENIAKLAERGIDEGLLDTLRSAGPKSAGHVNALVKASDEELMKLSDAFSKGGDTATKALSTSLGVENSVVMDSVGHMVTEAGQTLSQQIKAADFESLGAAMPEGTAKGVEKGSKDVAEATKAMAIGAEKEFTEAMQINSPSKVFEGHGGNITDGTKLGIENGTPAVIQTTKELAKSMIEQFKGIKEDFIKIGQDVAAGVDQGIKAGSDKVMATARNLANNIAIVMRKELDIHSPSKETTKIGKQTGEGVEVGLKSKQKAIATAARKAAQAARDQFKEVLENANYKYKMGEIDSSEFIKSLEKVRSVYAKTPEQVRKVNLQINNARKDSVKIAQQAAKETYENYKNHIEKRKRDNALSLSAELDAWLRVQSRYRAGTKERIDAEKNVARVRIELAKEMFDKAKDQIDKRKYYNQMSLSEELAAWEKIQDKYLKGTKEREEADKNVYRVKKEIGSKLVALEEEYNKKISDVNNKLASETIRINEEVANKTKAIKDKLSNDIIKAEEDLANKQKAVREKLVADQQRLNDDYAKSVESDYQRFKNTTGLFDYFGTGSKQSGDDLLKNLESQLDGLNDWEKEITDLSSKAIDDGLLAELREMGPKALPQLRALNGMTKEQLEEYSLIYQEKSAKARALAEKENEELKANTEKRLQELRQIANAELSRLQYDTQVHISAMRQAADSEISQMQNDAALRINQMRVVANAELEVLKTEWVEKISEVNKATKKELDNLKAIGKNAGQGLLNGLASMEGALVAKATSIAEAVKKAMASALDIHSPSRWMRDFIAGNMAVGFIQGIDKNEAKILKAASRFGEMLKPDLQAVSIPQLNIRPFNPNISGSAGGSSLSADNSKSFNPTFQNYFTRDESTPSEVTRKNKQQSQNQAMEWGFI